MIRSAGLVVLATVASTAEDFIIRSAAGSAPAAAVRLWPAGSFKADSPVSAQDAGGRTLGTRLVWAAPGQAATLLVETGGRAPLTLSLGGKAGKAWEPQAGVILEVRSRHPASPAPDDWTKAQKCLEQGRLQGRILVDRIFLGVNPCGPTRDVCLDFRGWLQAPAGSTVLATISGDASFVLLDGRPVVDWPGWHGIEHGKKGQRQQTVDLKAGIHALRYVNVQRWDWLLAALYWQPPGAKKIEVVPPGAFVQPDGWQAEPASAGPWFDWEPTGHAQWPAGGLVEMAFRARVPAGSACTWEFADGGKAAQGIEVRRCFARSGLRTVRLRVQGGNGASTTVERQVDVHPCWNQMQDWDEAVLSQRRSELAQRDPESMSGPDLMAVIRFAVACDDRPWMGGLVEVALQRSARLGPEGPQLFADLALLLQGPPWRDYGRSEACWRAAIGTASERSDRARCSLHLAGMLIHILDRAVEAPALLETIRSEDLTPADRRLLLLYRGDALLAAGEAEAARAAYVQAGEVVAESDVGYTVRRRARLELAKDWLARGEAEEALRVVREIEWETPSERLGAETGLLVAKAALLRKDPGPALSRSRLLLAGAPPDGRRAELLLIAAKALLLAGRREQAAEVVSKLLRDHPYSESAALARDLK